MNYNWCLGIFIIAVIAAGSKNTGRGKSSSSAVDNISVCM
jgi:hypothetical protein